jgi:hypothetical protein
MCENSENTNICEIIDSLTATATHMSQTNDPLQANGFPGQQQPPQNLEQENTWLRAQLENVAKDRDRLLCEVASLRLELDIQELKRLPEER